MSFFNTFENEVLDEILGASASLLTATVQIGLSTTTPAEDGSNITEPIGNGYSRVTVNNDGTQWPAAASGIKKNANDITFPAASGGDWGTITHFVIYDVPGGNPKIWGTLDDGGGTPSPKTITDGNQFRFLADELRIELD